MQHSKCKATGYLHDYQLVQHYTDGVLEVCAKCRASKFFRHNEPSRKYLAHHMRQILKPTNPRFAHEYGR